MCQKSMPRPIHAVAMMLFPILFATEIISKGDGRVNFGKYSLYVGVTINYTFTTRLHSLQFSSGDMWCSCKKYVCFVYQTLVVRFVLVLTNLQTKKIYQ